MRKLDTKNKTYIIGLLAFVTILIVIIIIFIINKVVQMNVKYDVTSGSVSFNSDMELVTASSDTYIKKNFLNNYYMVIDNENVYLEKSPVVFDQKTGIISLYGTFYEISNNGNVNKITDYNMINSGSESHVYKISDRKYLVISPLISSKDGSLKTNNFLLINIDKVGNAYIYNDDINMKTFNEFSLVTDKFTFNVNEEKLIIGDETIDLSKINGSTNTYKVDENSDTNETNNTTQNTTGDGDGTGTGGGGGNGYGNETNTTTETKDSYYVEEDLVNKYVKKKTTILGGTTTENTISINYVVYDPYEEYQNLYLNVYDTNGLLIETKNMDKESSNIIINNLKFDSTYRLDFHYTFVNKEGNIEDVLFDSINYTTKKIKATITLEKVSKSVVLFNVKIDTNSDLSSESSDAKVVMYIDDVYASEVVIDLNKAISSEGYSGQIEYSGLGDYATLKLEDCIFGGVKINATYKYKM